MRLDKFLKIMLIFKTRNSSEKYFQSDNIFINDKIAKPSSNIKVGDEILIKTIDKKTTYKVLEIKEKNVSKEEAKKLYQIIKEEKLELF